MASTFVQILGSGNQSCPNLPKCYIDPVQFKWYITLLTDGSGKWFKGSQYVKIKTIDLWHLYAIHTAPLYTIALAFKYRF